MSLVTYHYSNKGDLGNNGDSLEYKQRAGEYGVWAAADGFGDSDVGEAASSLAVHSIVDSFSRKPELTKKNIEDIFLQANNELLLKKSQAVGRQELKTAAVALFVNKFQVLWAYVGNCRLYYFKQGHLYQGAKAQSNAEASAAQSENSSTFGFHQSRISKDQKKPLWALGLSPTIRIDIQEGEEILQMGDAFLLCTDGFWGNINDIEMEADLVKASSPEQWVKYMTLRIYKRKSKGQDNFSAIAVMAALD